MLRLLVDADLHAPAHRGRASLLVAGERIVHVGPAPPDLGTTLAVERVELAGRRVVPGLVDGHVHVTGGGGEEGFASAVPAPPLSAFTTSGVTTVIGLLGTDDTVRSPAQVLARTRALRAEGLSAWCCTGGYHLPPATVTGSVRGDLVHIGPVLGVGEVAVSDHRSSAPTTAELARLASEVRVGALLAGKAGVLHLHVGAAASGLEPLERVLAASDVPPRVLHPTHVNRHRDLLEQAFALGRRGVTVDATASAPGDDVGDVPAADVVVRWLDEGAPSGRLTVSSDAGGSLPVFDAEGRSIGSGVGTSAALPDVLATLVGRGVPLADALGPLTRAPADHWGLPRKGRLEVGADADLVVLGDDDRPTDVMARGRWMVRDGRPVVTGAFERPPGHRAGDTQQDTGGPDQEGVT